MNIENAVALVTGANRGIGRALVEELVGAGAKRVYAAARDPRTLDSLAGTRDVIPLRLDVTDPEQIDAAVRAAGDVSLLVNNAGVLGALRLLETPREILQREFDTNFYGPLAMARAFVPVLERHGGAMVNVLTVVSLASMPGLGGYSATKAAALSLTQALRAELGQRGIRVHAVFPGPVDTDMIRTLDLPKTSAAEVALAIVRGVIAGQEDIAPDPMSRQILEQWARDPKAVERQFGAM